MSAEIDYQLVDQIIASGHTLTAMESCTGGLFASAITDRSGASEIFPGSYVTYGNDAKVKCGVDATVIETYGVYSAETAIAMAQACRAAYCTDIAVGITGSLGRLDPANPDSVVGRVHFAVCSVDGAEAQLVEIPPELEERADMKRYVVNKILAKVYLAIRA